MRVLKTEILTKKKPVIYKIINKYLEIHNRTFILF